MNLCVHYNIVNIYIQDKSAYVETEVVTNKRRKNRRAEEVKKETQKSAIVLNQAFKQLKRNHSDEVVDVVVIKKCKGM